MNDAKSENELPQEGEVVHVEDHESRVGTVFTEFREGERRRFVIEVSEKEFTVAQYTGLLIEHPEADRMIYWGPYRQTVDSDALTCCTVTKFTEPDLRSGGDVVYDHDELGDIEFRLGEHDWPGDSDE